MERRVGRRVPVEPMVIRWRVVPKEPRRHRRGASARGVQDAELIEMSVSGLLVEAPASDDLVVGHIVGIEIEGLVGRVKIRRIEALADSLTSRYGVEMLDPRSPFVAHIHQELTTIAETSAERWRGDEEAPWLGRHTPTIESVKVVMPVVTKGAGPAPT